MATFGDLKTYVEHDGWTDEPNLARRGTRTGDHWRYRKDLPDGVALRTKVSHGLRDEIGSDLFKHILRDQLRTTEDRFWAVVRGGARQAPETPPASVPMIPGWLVQRLISTVGLPEDDIRTMTVKDAYAVWEAHRARPRQARRTLPGRHADPSTLARSWPTSGPSTTRSDRLNHAGEPR